MVRFRYIIVNNLHKGDNKGNNNNNNNKIGATGIVTKSLKKNLEAVPGKRQLYLEHHT
jgi:hypothetical protein